MTSRLLQLILLNVKNDRRAFHATTASLASLFEKDRKGGYPQKLDRSEELTKSELIREGFRELASEIRLWKEEVQEKFRNDPILVYRRGETDVVWRFNGDKEALRQWVLTSDSDYDEGFSTCSLQMTQGGRGLFSGNLQTRVPKDGRVHRAGYCNVTTVPIRKSFKREIYLDWRQYSHLIMRVRGDGRSYMLNLSTSGAYDVLWNDIYHYVLYTRGGPYWQWVKIPFSKFFLASKGRVQDKQGPIPLDRIKSFGITAADKVDGQFRLEIDYVGLMFDPAHTEEFAYEMYALPKYIAGY